jgi:hypothetical protein
LLIILRIIENTSKEEKKKMKFLAIALASLTGFSEAKKIIDKVELNRRLKNGLVNKQTLMAGAKPANEYTKRKLDQNAFQINGKYSIQFDHCLSLTVQNDDLWQDANYVDMAANGDLISAKDYIIFNVCETEYCSYDSEDDKLTFIADVGTYFQALSQYLPTKVEEYCQACEQNYDYCYAQYSGEQYYPEGYQPEEEEEEEQAVEEEADAEEQAEDEQAEDEQAEGGRKLQNGQVVKFINCQMCADYECLDFQQTSSNGYTNENGEYVEVELNEAIEWLNGFSECAQTYAYLDEYVLYSGLMCNAYGNGLEIGLYLDEECTMYTPKIAYKDVMQSADQAYYGMIHDVVEFTFTNDGIECYDPEVVWYNEVDYYYQNQNAEQQDGEQEEDNGEVPEAAQWCQELVRDDSAVDLYDCGGYAPEDNGDEEGDDYVNTYAWYSYELKAEDAENVQAVCYVVQNLQGEHHSSYNGNLESLFDYKKTNKSGSSGGLSPGGIAGIVILVLVVVGAVAGGMFFLKKKDSTDKKKPLINEEGQLA